jgi:hypothetical protein
MNRTGKGRFQIGAAERTREVSKESARGNYGGLVWPAAYFFFSFLFLQQFFLGDGIFFLLESFFLSFTGSLAQHKRVCGNEDRLRHIHLARIKAHYLGTLGVSLNSGPMRKKLSNVTTM